MPIHASGWRRSILPILLVIGVSACERTGWKAQIARDKSPVQPIQFMHDVHVARDSIPCAYCHSSANVSEEAGIPSVGTCMGCHRFVAGGSEDATREVFTTEIQKLMGFAADSQPVPWNRVYSVPSFVQFTHKPHVRAGVTCAQCHGDVANMVQVSRATPLTMGWCVKCHRDQEASDDCSVCHY